MNDAPHTQQIAQLLQAIEPVLAPVRQSGWQWRVVGGAVRDLVLGRPVVDIDIEVVAPALADLERCYADMVPRGAVGSDRQVIRIRTAAHTVDITVATDADVHTAAAGRDLTINALAILPDGTLVDPHGGLADLRHGVLRHIGTAFADDPLRVLRLMRFAGQLN